MKHNNNNNNNNKNGKFILFPQTQIASLSYIGVRTSLFYLAPFDVILSVLIFETPYVFTKFGSMFVTLVSE